MNTSYDNALNGQAWSIEAFRYPSISSEQPPENIPQAADSRESERRETRAYESGLNEGKKRAQCEFETALTAERKAIQAALQHFKVERERYYQRVEAEVVQLALSIARKVLHREAQVDPLLLAGIVRVALKDMSDGTQVELRVNPAKVDCWREYFAASSPDGPTPTVVGDNSVAEGDCQIQTQLGDTTLGLDSQLKEIENGLFDLLAQRPPTQP